MDGIITNHPERLINVLREKEFAKKFRLATQQDNPWERIRSRADEVPSPNPRNNSQILGVRIVHGIGDLFNSLTKYVREFVTLRAPNESHSSQSIHKARQLSEKLELLDLVVNYIRILTVKRLEQMEQKDSKTNSTF